MTIDLASADELLTTTRAVRKRMDFSRPVDLSAIEACIEIALQAPAGTEPKRTAGPGDATPHFVVATDPELKKAMGELYAAAHHPYIDAGAKANPEREASGGFEVHRWFTDAMHEAPALVLVCSWMDVSALSRGMQVGVWGSVLPAAWSFMLALRARGLGATWTTAHLFDQEETMAKLLGIPEGVSQAVLMPVAYYTGTTFKRATRPSVDQVLHLNGW